MLRIEKLFLLTLLLLAGTKASFGQFYSLGNDPGRARWSIIESPNYKLIFPEETDSIARLYLFELERMRPLVMEQLGIDPRPIPVVLHPYTTLSNGSVVWAPKRSEMMTSPDPYDGSADVWIKHLTTHELRHVGQVEHYTKGPYNVLYYLIGEQITGVGLGLFTSRYVMEGDAVATETKLSLSGRGRSADFTKYTRALYISGNYRNWDQMLLGSYRYYTPDRYEFGYLLESYITYESRSFRFPGDYFSIPVKYWYNLPKMINPVRYSVGDYRKNFFKRSQKTLTRMWREDLAKRGTLTLPREQMHKRAYTYTEYTNSIYIDNPDSKFCGSTIAIKQGMSTSAKIVRIDSAGKEHFIHFFNNITSRLHYDGKRRIYWSETVSNEAAQLEDFSVVKYLDIESGKIRSMRLGTKYFNPSPSPYGKTIAVAEYPITGSTWLTILSAEDGKPLRRIEAHKKGQIKEIAHIGDRIYCTIVLDEGYAIYTLEDEDQWRRVSALQHQSIAGLRSCRDYLYFTSDLDGVLNIYKYYPESDSLIRITNSMFGADYAYIDPSDQMLYYSEFDTDGYRPVSNSAEELQSVVMDFERPFVYPLAQMLYNQHRDSSVAVPVDTFDIMNREKYPSKRYNKALHAFRIHSWYPLYVDLSDLSQLSLEKIFNVVAPGVTILSQNSLGTITSQISYGYKNRRHTGHFKMGAKIYGNFAGELRVDLNDRARLLYDVDYSKGEVTLRTDDKPLIFTSLTLYYPLNFNSKGWYRSLTPQMAVGISNDKFKSRAEGEYVYRNEFRYGITYGQVIPTALSQIFPRWGFGVSIFGSTIMERGEDFGDLKYIYGYGYLPGIFRNQGIKVTFAAQKQVLGKTGFLLSSLAAMPRGYTDPSLYPTDTYYKVSLDYALPIHVGDFNIGPVIYFKRIQLIPFGDYARDTDFYGRRKDFYSFGAEVLFDINVLRLSFPLSLGFRYSHTGPQPQSGRDHFNFLFNVSF